MLHIRKNLELLHGSNIGALDVVLVLSNLLLEVVQRDLVVLNNTVDLELLDTEADLNELRTTPDETVHLNGLDVGKELVEVGLIIPRLDVNGDDRLGSGLSTLSSLLSSVLSKSLLLQLLSLVIDLIVVRAKEIDIIVLLLSSRGSGLGGSGRGSSRGSSLAKVRGLGGLVTREGDELRSVSLDVGVPAGGVGELGSIGGRADSLEDNNISLGSVDTEKKKKG